MNTRRGFLSTVVGAVVGATVGRFFPVSDPVPAAPTVLSPWVVSYKIDKYDVVGGFIVTLEFEEVITECKEIEGDAFILYPPDQSRLT